MRKSLWIILAVMVVAVCAPNAHADSFTYAYTGSGISWTTEAIPAVTMETTLPAADLTFTSNTGSAAGCVTLSVVLDFMGLGTVFTNVSGCNFLGQESGVSLTLTEYATPGLYTGSALVGPATDSLVVSSAVATPEPSSVMLLGSGLLGLMRLRRKRLT